MTSCDRTVEQLRRAESWDWCFIRLTRGDDERKEVLDLLCSERFVDEAPTTVHAKLLDEEQRYLCCLRTMFRVLEAENVTRERRADVGGPH